MVSQRSRCLGCGLVGGAHADGWPGRYGLLGASWQRREQGKHNERTAQADMHDSPFPATMGVLLRRSRCTTLQPLHQPSIDRYLGNPHPPLASWSHGDFREREDGWLLFSRSDGGQVADPMIEAEEAMAFPLLMPLPSGAGDRKASARGQPVDTSSKSTNCCRGMRWSARRRGALGR